MIQLKHLFLNFPSNFFLIRVEMMSRAAKALMKIKMGPMPTMKI